MSSNSLSVNDPRRFYTERPQGEHNWNQKAGYHIRYDPDSPSHNVDLQVSVSDVGSATGSQVATDLSSMLQGKITNDGKAVFKQTYQKKLGVTSSQQVARPSRAQMATANRAASSAESRYFSSVSGQASKIGSKFLKHLGGNLVGCAISAYCDIKEGTPPKEAIGKAVVTTAATAMILAANPVGMGLVVGVVVGVAVGAGVSAANDWARQACPALAEFEDAIGDAVVQTYDDAKQAVQETYDGAKHVVQETYDGAKQVVQETYDEAKQVATQTYDGAKKVVKKTYDDTKKAIKGGKTLLDETLVNKAVDSLKAIKAPLKNIQKENSSIASDLQNALDVVCETAAQAPFLTWAAIDEIISDNRLKPEQRFSESDVTAVNKQVADQLSIIDKLTSGLTNAAKHIKQQDTKAAADFNV